MLIEFSSAPNATFPEKESLAGYKHIGNFDIFL